MICWRELINDDKTEEELIEILRDDKLLLTYNACVNCLDEDNLTRPRKERIKCKTCQHEWSVRKGGILENSKLSLKSFLLLYHLYLDGLSSLKASKIAQVNKNTALKIFHEFKKL